MYSSFICFFVFFKQKTAYEMRISDWSSDVCSSDLPEMRPSGSEIAPGATFPPAPPSQLDHHPLRLAFQERQFATWPLALSLRSGRGVYTFLINQKAYRRSPSILGMPGGRIATAIRGRGRSRAGAATRQETGEVGRT